MGAAAPINSLRSVYLNVLTCISFLNELPLVFMRGWDIHGRTSFVIEMYCTFREMNSWQLLTLYFTLTQIFSGGKEKVNLHTSLKLTEFMPISMEPYE